MRTLEMADWKVEHWLMICGVEILGKYELRVLELEAQLRERDE